MSNIFSKNPTKSPAQQVVTLDPKFVHPPAVSCRHASAFSGAEFDELKMSIQLAGENVQPVLVRSCANAEGHFDLIFGERRHRACLESTEPVQLRAIVDESQDDVEAFFKSVRENNGRKALSPLELGQQILYALERGIFENQDDAARKLCRNKSAVSRAVAVASLPPEVISAFRSADDLQYRYAKNLVDAVRQAPDLVKVEALKIKAGGDILTPQEVKTRLLRAAGINVAPLNKHDAVDMEFDGRLFAKLTFGIQGNAQVKLDFGLDSAQQDALVALLKRFYKQSLTRSAAQEHKSNVLSFKQATKMHEKLKIQIASASRDIKNEAARVNRLGRLKKS